MQAIRVISASASSDDCGSDITSPRRSSRHHSSQNEAFLQCREAILSDLSVGQLQDLVSSLKSTLGTTKAENYELILHEECIDGAIFSQLGHDELIEIGFDPGVKTILEQNLTSGSPPTKQNVGACPPIVPPVPPPPVASEAFYCERDHQSPLSYGHLIVLGYREYRLNSEQVIHPIGSGNYLFPLLQQSEPTGVKIATENTYYFQESNSATFVETSDATDMPCGCHETTHHLSIGGSYKLQKRHELLQRGPWEGLVPYKVEVGFIPDPEYDMFQVGRHEGATFSHSAPAQGCYSPRPRVNDVVVKGLVMLGPGGGKTSSGGVRGSQKASISRVACRLLCSRSTGRTFVFAGGFDASNTMTLSNKASQWVCRKTEATATATATATTSRRDSRSSTRTGGLRLDSDQPFSRRTSSSSSEYDAFTAQGVKVFFPDVGSWREVSVMGNVYTTREEGGTCGVLTSQTNELVSGCIVDVGGGVCLSFSTSLAVQRTSPILVSDAGSSQHDPNQFIARLNSRTPQCPVLMNTLHFPPSLPPERYAQVRLQNLRSGNDKGFVIRQQTSSEGTLSTPLPSLAVDGFEQDQQPYVFTACGHCFGYNSAFSGKACPLCRQTGPYVPLLFPFTPAICADLPTHVFHPCGHAASLQTCLRWSHIPMPDSTSLHEYLFPQSCRGNVGAARGRTTRRQLREGGRALAPGTQAQVGEQTRVSGGAVAAEWGAVSAPGASNTYTRYCPPRHPACPFCGKKLGVTASGERFSKLLVQFEDSDISLADI